jgi:hypothetical protein
LMLDSGGGLTVEVRDGGPGLTEADAAKQT